MSEFPGKGWKRSGLYRFLARMRKTGTTEYLFFRCIILVKMKYQSFFDILVAVWHSGNIVGRVNEVTLRRAGLYTAMDDRSRAYRLGT